MATERKLNYAKACLAVLLAIYGFICARSFEDGSFLDRVDLVAHEAGHRRDRGPAANHPFH